MRTRVTIYPCDSFAIAPVHVGTPDSFAHILMSKFFSDIDLKQALRMGAQILPQATVELMYREIQIHGPIKFAQDISAVVIPNTERNPTTTSHADQFTKTHNVPVLYI